MNVEGLSTIGSHSTPWADPTGQVAYQGRYLKAAQPPMTAAAASASVADLPAVDIDASGLFKYVLLTVRGCLAGPGATCLFRAREPIPTFLKAI